jgi:predicted membrane protein
VASLVYPLVLGAVVSGVFAAPPQIGDVAAAALAHLACALLGGALALLFSPPRVTRRATGIALVIGALLVLVAVSGPLGVLGGPLAVAEALTDAAPGTVGGDALPACLSCVVLAAGVLATAARWSARSG